MFESLKRIFGLGDKHLLESKQSIAFAEIYNQIWNAIYLIDEALGTYSWIVDVYLESDDRIFAVISQNGKLFKQHFSLEDDVLLIGDIEEIDLDSVEPNEQQQRTQIYQQKDGRYRWLSIAATTALNKNAELNSKELYDSFIDHINETGEYPILNFYHQPNTRLGIADYVARDDNLYILSGTFDNNEYGIAAAKGIANKEDYWGDSIEFWALEGKWLEVDIEQETVYLPVYTAGINTAVSILPEKDARCLGTVHISNNKNQSRGLVDMDEKVKEELNVLFDGDEELVDSFAQSADSINQEINETMVHQSADIEETETVEEETEDVEETETEDVIVELDETFIDDLLVDLSENESFEQHLETRFEQFSLPIVQRLQTQIENLQNELKQVKQTLQQNQEKLQETEVEQRERWENDLPQKTIVSYRARNRDNDEVVQTNGKPESYADVASKTLKKIGG